MSVPSKKRVLDPKKKVEADSSSDDSSSDEDDYKGGEQIQVEFEGRIPVDSDFHGIKQLLQQLFLKTHLNISDLAELIIKQNYVGSVVKQCDDNPDSDDDDDDSMNVDDDVFGITTVINLTDKRSMGCVSQLRDLLKEHSSKHGDDRTIAKVKQLLDDETKCTGLLINERFVNIPPQVAVPLLMSLRKEMDKAKSRNMPFNFEYLILICKLYKVDSMKKKSKKNKNKPDEPAVIWSNAEEEVFEEVADCKFEFCVKDDSDSGLGGKWHEDDTEMTPWRKVLIFHASKLDEAIEKVTNLIQQ
ncbi:protein BCCIP homolog [Thrips palmi]|uniref:Protein BCCIP homolog n=1 Tax=Thrips palmi TaxID=161013 RepID=A0A6P9ADX2_THRPL|nr:protein BCCIP homolog [Thrips palmi]XP_034256432.1 protein BCCIP homolog [Thrips palmi]